MPSKHDWMRKAVVTGLVGGAVMATYLMVVMGVTGRGFFTPIDLVAATLPPFRPVISGFLPMAALSGLAGHLIVSALWGVALGFLIGRFFRARSRAHGRSYRSDWRWGSSRGE